MKKHEHDAINSVKWKQMFFNVRLCEAYQHAMSLKPFLKFDLELPFTLHTEQRFVVLGEESVGCFHDNVQKDT